MNNSSQVNGELHLRTQAFPADANPAGDIFGGWVLSQMDIAGAIFAKKRCNGRVVTVSIDSMSFLEPVFVGDVICCYVDSYKEGKTSLAVKVEVWAVRENDTQRFKVTEGIYKYVAVDGNRKPRSIDSKEK
ncbi:MAG: acyl-CoA thioesterase [Bacteriovoracaceae bacterium]|nr:acyl-CoA thioesterase [Bacteriovoracaceae bacterium]